jgi:hypothetical protein
MLWLSLAQSRQTLTTGIGSDATAGRAVSLRCNWWVILGHQIGKTLIFLVLISSHRWRLNCSGNPCRTEQWPAGVGQVSNQQVKAVNRSADIKLGDVCS